MTVSLLSINSNVSSLAAQRRLSNATDSLTAIQSHLSSGQRIDNASDDAAGLAISQSLKSASRIYTQAVRNLNDGMSMLSIGEGALKELSNITVRQIELAEQSANGTFTLAQRKAINVEANALSSEYNRIVRSTSFNGRNILDVSNNGGALLLQGGLGSDGVLQISVGEELARTVGDGTYQAAISYLSEGSWSTGVSLVDLNADGTLDLITGGYKSSTGGFATVRLGVGDGSFGAATSYLMDTANSNSLAVLDVNGDAIADVVTSGVGGGVGRLTIRLGAGDGTFGAALSYLTETSYSSGLSAGDIDGNGTVDIVTSGKSSTNLGYATVFLGMGDGTFSAGESYLAEPYSSRSAVLEDLNGDGKLDLVTSGDFLLTGGGGYATIRLGNGDGSFGTPLSYETESSNSYDVNIADLNGDGLLDLVTAGKSSGLVGFATVRLGNGDGSFQGATSYQMDISSSAALSLTDVNGDGIVDLTTAGTAGGAGSVSIRLGNGDGSFGAALSYIQETGGSKSICFGDINKDGALDLVTAGGAGTGRASVRLATPITLSAMPRLNLLSQNDSKEALSFLKMQLDRIESELGNFGSFESRLAVAAKVLQVSRENYLAANSRIEDADIAAEAGEMSRL